MLSDVGAQDTNGYLAKYCWIINGCCLFGGGFAVLLHSCSTSNNSLVVQLGDRERDDRRSRSSREVYINQGWGEGMMW